MLNEVANDIKLLYIVMFIFILANWYLLIYIIARGFKKISNSIEQLKGGK